MALDHALRYPVLTIGSGPANSVRGAAFLTGSSDSLVVDVGGTSTDVGVLVNGFPRESSQGVEIGGIRTNFRMPDLVTIALGGGTRGHPGPRRACGSGRAASATCSTSEALVFGGTTPTLTDSAVAAGRADAGRRRRCTGRHRRLLGEALARADVMLAEAIDRVKTSKEDRALVAVGGGSILVPDRIPGISEVIRPEHFDTANAVGAAIASVSGQVDRIFHLGPAGGGRPSTRPATRPASTRSPRAPTPARCRSSSWRRSRWPTSPRHRVRIRAKAAGTLGGLLGAATARRPGPAGTPGRPSRPIRPNQPASDGPLTDRADDPVTDKDHGGIHEAPPRRAAVRVRLRAGAAARRLRRLVQLVGPQPTSPPARCSPTTRPPRSWTTAGIRRPSTPTASSR